MENPFQNKLIAKTTPMPHSAHSIDKPNHSYSKSRFKLGRSVRLLSTCNFIQLRLAAKPQ